MLGRGTSKSSVRGRIGAEVKELGGRLRHRKERHYGCKERDLLVLFKVSFEAGTQAIILHLLKLVTGVEISTRAVNRSGRPGNEVKSRSRTAAAPPKITAFLLSMLMLEITET
jgi:hypothetical protein